MAAKSVDPFCASLGALSVFAAETVNRPEARKLCRAAFGANLLKGVRQIDYRPMTQIRCRGYGADELALAERACKGVPNNSITPLIGHGHDQHQAGPVRSRVSA